MGLPSFCVGQIQVTLKYGRFATPRQTAPLTAAVPSASNAKLTYTDYTPITLYPTAPLYNIIIIYDTILRQRRHFKHEK